MKRPYETALPATVMVITKRTIVENGDVAGILDFGGKGLAAKGTKAGAALVIPAKPCEARREPGPGNTCARIPARPAAFDRVAFPAKQGEAFRA